MKKAGSSDVGPDVGFGHLGGSMSFRLQIKNPAIAAGFWVVRKIDLSGMDGN
jgi:hypothetical protein